MAHPLTHCMTSDLEDLTEEGEVEEEGLAALQEEVDSLQETFDRAVIEKHSLGLSCQQLAEKLKTANHLLERYRENGLGYKNWKWYPITTIGPSSGCNSSFASNFSS